MVFWFILFVPVFERRGWPVAVTSKSQFPVLNCQSCTLSTHSVMWAGRVENPCGWSDGSRVTETARKSGHLVTTH